MARPGIPERQPNCSNIAIFDAMHKVDATLRSRPQWRAAKISNIVYQ
jgi:hypothetical protein